MSRPTRSPPAARVTETIRLSITQADSTSPHREGRREEGDVSGAWHDEWRITGDPTVIVEGVECAFPSYLFVYDSRDDRWPGEQAEAQARAWVAQRGSDRLGWRDGPFLHHRRVFIGEWTPDVTTGIARAAAWEKAERYAGRAGGEPEVEYWVVAAHGDLWGERRYDDIAEARQKAERCQADGDEVRICKVTVTRTRDWVPETGVSTNITRGHES